MGRYRSADPYRWKILFNSSLFKSILFAATRSTTSRKSLICLWARSCFNAWSFSAIKCGTCGTRTIVFSKESSRPESAGPRRTFVVKRLKDLPHALQSIKIAVPMLWTIGQGTGKASLLDPDLTKGKCKREPVSNSFRRERRITLRYCYGPFLPAEERLPPSQSYRRSAFCPCLDECVARSGTSQAFSTNLPRISSADYSPTFFPATTLVYINLRLLNFSSIKCAKSCQNPTERRKSLFEKRGRFYRSVTIERHFRKKTPQSHSVSFTNFSKTWIFSKPPAKSAPEP